MRLFRRLNEKQHQIHFVECIFCRANHVFAKLMAWLMDAGCIEKYTLKVIFRQYACDFVACRLRLMRGDGDFFTNQAVHQCGFAYVWSACQRNETGIKFFHACSSSAAFLAASCSARNSFSFASQSCCMDSRRTYCSQRSFFVSISSCVKPFRSVRA